MLLLRAPLIFPRSEAGDAEAGPDWSSPHNPVSPADGVGHLAPPASPHLTSPRDLPADRVRDLGGRVRAQPQPGGGGGLCESPRVRVQSAWRFRSYCSLLQPRENILALNHFSLSKL